MKHSYLLLFFALLSLLCASCVSKIPICNLTVASTKNMDLENTLHVVDEDRKVSARDLKHIIILFPTGSPSIEEAVAKAQESIPGCVGLTNVTISHYSELFFLFIYCRSGYEVEGYPLFKAEKPVSEAPVQSGTAPQKIQSEAVKAVPAGTVTGKAAVKQNKVSKANAVKTKAKTKAPQSGTATFQPTVIQPR